MQEAAISLGYNKVNDRELCFTIKSISSTFYMLEAILKVNSEGNKFCCDKASSKWKLNILMGLLRNFKKSVRQTIDTFKQNKKFHTAMKMLNYRFIKWTYLVVPVTHWVSVQNFQPFKGMVGFVGWTGIKITVCNFWLQV